MREDGSICRPIARKLLPAHQSTVKYRGLVGGRAGAKSHFVAEELVLDAISTHIRCACMREVQASIRDSSKQLVEDKIAQFNLSSLFDVTDTEIVCPSTDSLFVFKGLRKNTVNSVKSMEGFNRGWIEEAHSVTQRSVDIVIPTFRTDGTRFWCTWNRNSPDDPIDKLFVECDGDPDFLCIECNYDDNPWLPEDTRRDIERDKRRDPEKYAHIWGGKYITNSEARVFKNWRVEDFVTPDEGVFFLHGADWGYSIDPTVLVRCFIGDWQGGKAVYNPKGQTLFIDYCVRKVGVEIDNTPLFFDSLVPGYSGAARRWQIIADSANPQAISYLRRHGYEKIKGSIKGAGSIKEGVKFLQSYDIVVHSRAKAVIDELTHFSYKRDPITNAVTPVLSDKKNHVIDSLRYALEDVRRPKGIVVQGRY